MTSKKTKQTLDVVEQSREPVQTRLDKRTRDLARLYGIPCRCFCSCRVRHRYGDVCVLCRDGDHWENLASYLKKIESRQTDQRAEQDYYNAVDRETFENLAQQE